MSKLRLDHKSEASTDKGQDDDQAVGMAKSDDQRLGIIGIITPTFGAGCGFTAEASVYRCDFRTCFRGVPGGQSRGSGRRCSHRARNRNIHPDRVLSSTWIVCAASSLATSVIARASSNALITVFLTFVVWNREGILRRIRLLPVTANADVGEGFLFVPLAFLCTDRRRIGLPAYSHSAAALM